MSAILRGRNREDRYDSEAQQKRQSERVSTSAGGEIGIHATLRG